MLTKVSDKSRYIAVLLACCIHIFHVKYYDLYLDTKDLVKVFLGVYML